MTTYVLNVATGREEYSANLLSSLAPLVPYFSRIWIPQKPVFYRSQGSIALIHTVLYPSYVFVDSVDYYSLLSALREHHLYSYLNLLGKGAEDIKRVSAEELEWIKRLGEISTAVLTDNRIHFTTGPLVGCDEAVKKYDRHKRSVMIRTEFLGQMRDVWLAVDVTPPLHYPSQNSDQSPS